MDLDAVWRTIDAERSSVADLLDGLSPQEWETPSLCVGWRVREVGAHLTLAHVGVASAGIALLRAGGGFNRMIYETAVVQARRVPPQRYGSMLRAMVGSRRHAPGITPLEPLLDVLVHGQDIAIPLGLRRTMPPHAAAVAASRAWAKNWPFRTRRNLTGLRLIATDVPWSRGEGAPVEGPICALLLLLTGRWVAMSQLSGEGAQRLSDRPVGNQR